ncbi:MAG: GTP-binding protein [Candidatus Lokiarchaeota archaeon]|nr:GTP-binding protein [Candidatus Lokiarchaeota archaeon]
MNANLIFKFKIVVIGDGAVGKTSLIKKFTKGAFEKDYIKTIGAQFSRFTENVEGNTIELLFWDIAGQNDFDFLKPIFYKETKACIIVYSLEENNLGEESLFHLKSWHGELEKYCNGVPVVVFANKVDLVREDELDLSELHDIINNMNVLAYYLTSAKTGKGVNEGFQAIIAELYQRHDYVS